MRTYRTVAALALALALSAPALGGCTPGGAGAPASPPGTGATAARTPPATTGPGTGPTPAPTAPTAAPTPAPTAGDTRQLLRVTRSGGFAGHRSTLDIREDGSWTLLDGSGHPAGAGKLTASHLDALRGALRQADFAHLPPVATGQGKVFDGFSYSFVRDGHEVVATDGSVPPALMKVLDALPSFEQS
ncbi:hypothetical protein ABT084_37240 [Streptomyces sp. NPDC002138]|uniref:hypothetical protein n=1 Tax=Streptomyces sp. NPDC002138 TaxID=3154410 RepID=UPI00331827C9